MSEFDADLEKARELLSAAGRVVFFTGAGVSADSGVPTFRGHSGESFWERYDPQVLCTPEGFAANPQLVHDFYARRRQQLRTVEPNAAHRAIARWQATNRAIVITQNVDGLHERVAPAGAQVLRLHGSLAEDRCNACDYTETVSFDPPPPLRHCPKCSSAYLRPAIVFFNEPLDPDVWSAAEDACSEADLMVVVGTSGEVWPAAGLVHTAARRGHVIVVNLEGSSLDVTADVVLLGHAAEIVPKLTP